MADCTRVTTPMLFEGVHQRQGVHHGCQHAHVIRGGAVHAHLQPHPSAPQVACADHDGHIHTQFAHLAHAAGNIQGSLGVDAFTDSLPRASPPSFSRMRWIFESFHLSSSLNIRN